MSTLGAAAAATAVSSVDGAAAGRRPNIIFILADDLGYGHLGCYGQKRIKTPRLDRMAEEGLRFTSTYSGSPVCAPSRCTLMTGLHTGHCRIRGNANRGGDRVPLTAADITVAEVLRAVGYTTGIFGKWGLGEPGTPGVPNKQGFDEWFGYLNQRHAHSYYPEYLWDNERKVDIAPGTYSHDLFTDRALDFVRRRKDVPFFLYLAYTAPHAILEPPSDAPYTGRGWPQPEKNLAAMITRLDADVGRLLDLLKELGIAQDTIVFFTSDNGPHSEGGSDSEFFDGNGPLRGMKRDVYEGGLRVPMIVWGPGRIRPGRTSSYPWAFWDFLPTAADLSGAEAPSGLDGISVRRAILGAPQPVRSPLYWEFHEGETKQAVRSGDWKAVRLSPESPLELYDLSRDIGEEQDVALEHPEIVRRMEKLMTRMRTRNSGWPVPHLDNESE